MREPAFVETGIYCEWGKGEPAVRVVSNAVSFDKMKRTVLFVQFERVTWPMSTNPSVEIESMDSGEFNFKYYKYRKGGR